MKNVFKNVNWKKVGTFAGGVLFGTAGISILSSKDAKKAKSMKIPAVRLSTIMASGRRFLPR